MWDYAELSKIAKQNGGPEKLVEKLVTASRKSGRRDMYPVVALVGVAGSAVTLGVVAIVKHFKKKRQVSETELEKAKKELVDGIKKYDAEHPESEETSEIADNEKEE